MQNRKRTSGRGTDSSKPISHARNALWQIEAKPGVEALFRKAVYAVVAVGVLLRLRALPFTLHGDELHAEAKAAHWGLNTILFGCDPIGPNHQLNSILTWLSTSLFGASEWTFRLPSFALGVILLAVYYIFAKSLTRSSLVAAGALLLLAVSPYHAAYSAASRGYSSVMLFLVLSTWLCYTNLGNPNVLKSFGLFISGFFLALAHAFALLYLGALGMGVCIYAAGRFVLGTEATPVLGKALGTSLAAIAAAVAAILAVWEPSAGVYRQIITILTTRNFLEGTTASEWFSESQNIGLTDILHEVVGFGGGIAAAAGILSVIGVIVLVKLRPRAGVLMGALLGVVVIAFYAGQIYMARYAASIAPIFLLAVAAGIVAVARVFSAVAARLPIRARAAHQSVAIVLFLLFALMAVPQLWAYMKGPGAAGLGSYWDVAGAMDYLEAHAKPEDIVLVFPLNRDNARGKDPKLVNMHTSMTLYLNRFFQSYEPGPPLTKRTVWYITPVKEWVEHDVLPDNYNPVVAAEFTNCIVYVGTIDTPSFSRISIPGQSLEVKGGRLLEWGNPYIPAGKAATTVEYPLKPSEPPRIHVKILANRTAWELWSPPLRVVPHRIIEAFAEVTWGRNGLITFAFMDSQGKGLSNYNWAPTMRMERALNSAPPDGWYSMRLATLVPPEARTVRLVLREFPWSIAGQHFSFRSPVLYGDWEKEPSM